MQMFSSLNTHRIPVRQFRQATENKNLSVFFGLVECRSSKVYGGLGATKHALQSGWIAPKPLDKPYQGVTAKLAGWSNRPFMGSVENPFKITLSGRLQKRLAGEPKLCTILNRPDLIY